MNKFSEELAGFSGELNELAESTGIATARLPQFEKKISLTNQRPKVA